MGSALIINVAINLGSRILAIIVGVLLARNLGVSGYGVYALCLSIVTVILVFTDLGMPTLIIRELSAAVSRNAYSLVLEIINTAVKTVAAASALTGLALSVVIMLLQNDILGIHATAIVASSLLLPITAINRVLSSALKGLGRVNWSQACDQIFTPTLSVLLVASLFFTDARTRVPTYALYSQFVATSLSVAVLALLVRMRVSPFLDDRKVESRTAGRTSAYWIGKSSPFVLVAATLLINNQIDVVILGWLRPPHDVGIYRVAGQGAMLVGFGLQVFNVVAAPVFARQYARQDSTGIRRTLLLARIASGGSALAVTIFLFMFGQAGIAILFGPEYEASFIPMMILCAGFLVNAAFGPVGVLLSMTGHERAMIKILIGCGVATIIADVVAAIWFGPVGVATSTALSLASFHLLFSIFASKSVVASR